MTADPLDSKRARGSIRAEYYEITEMLALIDHFRSAWEDDEEFERALIQSFRSKLKDKERAIRKRLEKMGELPNA